MRVLVTTHIATYKIEQQPLDLPDLYCFPSSDSLVFMLRPDLVGVETCLMMAHDSDCKVGYKDGAGTQDAAREKVRGY